MKSFYRKKIFSQKYFLAFGLYEKITNDEKRNLATIAEI
jgi:hypothetical protein